MHETSDSGQAKNGPMRVFVCHGYYQRRGGEDEVFDAEVALLRERGHKVLKHTVNNDIIDRSNLLSTGIRATWNGREHQRIKESLLNFKPDLVHVYNTFPLLSPSVYYAAKSQNLPVVQSLHNYRLMCVNSSFYRSGKPCEDCLGKTLMFSGIRHGCYHNSRLQSSAVALMNGVHRLIGTWKNKIDMYLLGSTQFALEKFKAAGIPSERIMLKPNFVYPDPGFGLGGGGYALFIGRFDAEKGIEDLLDAWRVLDQPLTLKMVGDGPLAALVERAAAANSRIQSCGRMPLADVYELMKKAEFLIFPSRWYEAMPRTIIDAFAVGTPVLASRLGVMKDLLDDQRSGLLFEPGDVADLVRKVREMNREESTLGAMRTRARQAYLDHYTADQNYEMIMGCYERAIENNQA